MRRIRSLGSGGADAISADTATHIRRNIADYGEVLIEFPDLIDLLQQLAASYSHRCLWV